MWLESSCPSTMRTPMPESESVWGGRNETFVHPDSRIWLERMAQRGWTAPGWPPAYGGAGLDPARVRILEEEMRRLGCRPPLLSFGIWMLGPVLLRFGTEAQRREHLPRIARGEIRWCQGFSEPEAGSDLASLRTRAEDCGDHWRASGQKIWTSHADRSDWMFCLVRTAADAPSRQRGLSLLLFDMQSRGVRTRPIRLISGNSPFCEVFLDDVRVPKENLVGELNDGWTVAKYLLEHERHLLATLGSAVESGAVGGQTLEALAMERAGSLDGRIADGVLRDAIVRQRMNEEAFDRTVARVAAQERSGGDASALASLLKLCGTEVNQSRHELRMEIMGIDALVCGTDGMLPDVTRDWLRSRANSIEGGTTEVQLNVIARRVLGLPAAGRPA